MDFPDASNVFEPLFSSKSINDEDTSNPAFYRNPRVDDLVDRARKELDSKARAALSDEANTIVCDEAPWAFTYTVRWYDVWQPYVRDYRTHPILTQHVAGVWLDREAERRAAAPMSMQRMLGSLLGARGRR